MRRSRIGTAVLIAATAIQLAPAAAATSRAASRPVASSAVHTVMVGSNPGDIAVSGRRSRA